MNPGVGRDVAQVVTQQTRDDVGADETRAEGPAPEGGTGAEAGEPGRAPVGVETGSAGDVGGSAGGVSGSAPSGVGPAVLRVLRSGLVRTFWMLLGLFGLLECIPLVTGDQPWPAVPAPLLIVAGGVFALRASSSSLPDEPAERRAIAAAASSVTGLTWFVLAVALWA